MSAPTAPSQPHAHTNALIRETSPYLLQHAHNPVDWHPWGPAAFELARAQDKPIFLSIGYSTCYWCHVMERESFESEPIAALMNEHFVNIKVDREERPDVDDIYMSAVQLMTGQGGWPMSVFLEPRTLKPFYAGTYFPAQPMYGRQSFPDLLRGIHAAWLEQRGAVAEQAARVAEGVRRQLASPVEPASLSGDQVSTAIAMLKQAADAAGGFGSAPKFPQPVFLNLLVGAAWDDPSAREAMLHALDAMALGGIFDHVGGGFHRYSTDAQWLIPHFEKMLYDNGQLASIYAEAFERTGDPLYASTLWRTLDYVLREMTDPAGGFYSAQDAEVDGHEGRNYLWKPEELDAVLRAAGMEREVEFAIQAYSLTHTPNFRDPHHPDDDGGSVLARSRGAARLNRGAEAWSADDELRLQRVNATLLAARRQRQQPRLDDKILAGWNGLMIAGMADGARVLKEPCYLEAAGRAADFVLASMRSEDGGLLRSCRAGEARIPAFLEDYAFLARGLLALHRATADATRLTQAAEVMQAARARFFDDASGGYFDTLADQADLFVRTKSTHDGAVPSGNSVMLHNLLDLHRATKEPPYLDDAARTMHALSSAVAQNPLATSLATLALHRLLVAAPERLRSPDSGAPPPVAAGARSDPVAIEAGDRRLRLDHDRAATTTITLTISAPYHINAHQPGDKSLIPLEVRLEGAPGLRLHADYPPGEAYRGEVRIHRERVLIPIRIERVGPAAGRPRLLVTYQPCSDEACLRPVTKAAPIDIIVEAE